MKNDEVYEQAFLRHSTLLVHYSIFLFSSGLSGLWAGVLFDYAPLEFIRAPGPITIK